MYQFTREFIINDNIGKLTNDDGNKVKFFTNTTADTMFIDNMVNLVGKQVVAAYTYAGSAAANESVEAKLPVADLEEGDVVRLVVTLGQEGRVISYCNDAYPDHSNQIFIEAIFKDTVANLVADIVKAFNNTYKDTDFTLATIEANASTGATGVCINCKDEFTRVKNVRFVKVNVGAPSGNMTGYGDYEVLLNVAAKDFEPAGVTAVVKVKYCTKGTLGVGTTNYILENLRLPSTANVSPFGAANRDERPVPNGIYDQYTVEVATERRQIGHQVTGALDRSLTTMIFFVLQGDTSTAFSNALKGLSTITTVTPAVDAAVTATNVGYHKGTDVTGTDKIGKAAATVDAEAVAEDQAIGD